MITLLKLGETVEYYADSNVRGTVVGFGFVDNGADPSTAATDRIPVVLVSLITVEYTDRSRVPVSHLAFAIDRVRRVRAEVDGINPAHTHLCGEIADRNPGAGCACM